MIFIYNLTESLRVGNFMYLEYWGFKLFPFENVPDPRFLYLSQSHEEALSRLLYAARMGKGGAVLSGEVGCGKTTLAKACIQELSGGEFDMALVVNPRLEPVEFLQEVLYQFGIPDVPDSKVKCLRSLNDKMARNRKDGRKTLLLVDEAQLLPEASIEEIRLLLNVQLDDRLLITVLLFGQPELKGIIKKSPQLDQRVPIKYHLPPFDLEDSGKYIVFREKKAGRGESAFNREAIERIFKHTGGVPRKINNLCDLSLLVGYSRGEKMIDANIVETIIQDGALL
jgi:general secretion pathway protein A